MIRLQSLVRFAAVLSTALTAPFAAAQVLYSASFASNPDQWGNYSWQDANGSISFSAGHLTFSTTGTDPYIGSYGPSGVPDWDGAYFPLDVSAGFAPGFQLRVSFDAYATVPNGVAGLALELQTPFPFGYIATSAPLTDSFQSFSIVSPNFVENSPVPNNVRVIAFATGGANVGTVGVRNLVIEVIPEPSSFALLGALAALVFAGLRRRKGA